MIEECELKHKNQNKLAFLKAQRTVKLTSGDLRGLAAAKSSAKRLKAKYSAVGPISEYVHSDSEPVFFSVMAGPIKK